MSTPAVLEGWLLAEEDPWIPVTVGWRRAGSRGSGANGHCAVGSIT